MKIGIRITPEWLESLVTTGNKVWFEVLDGIPHDFKLQNFGIDIDSQSFYLICAKDPQEGESVMWITPKLKE